LDLDDWRMFFTAICTFLIIITFTPLFIKLTPDRSESFIELAILGENKLANNYYPDDDPNIEILQKIKWHLYLYNHVAEPMFVELKVKLSNSTVKPPNSTTCRHSKTQEIFNIRKILRKNETWIKPITWEIKKILKENGKIKIENISFEDYTTQATIISNRGEKFRIIFELWIFDKESKDFEFGWKKGDKVECLWNQIWFGLK
jgi:uncharacterized membrane protein